MISRPNDDKTKEHPTAVATAPPANMEAGKVVPAAAKADQVGRVHLPKSESHTEREARFSKIRWQGIHRDARELEERNARTFLEKLVAAIRAGRIAVTPWEEQFVIDHVDHPRPFSERQDDSVHEMRRKYEHQLKP